MEAHNASVLVKDREIGRIIGEMVDTGAYDVESGMNSKCGAEGCQIGGGATLRI